MFALTVGVECSAFTGDVDTIPNGIVFNCDTCHSSGNDFIQDYENAGHQWSFSLAMMDSDSDGYSNGEELQDPDGTWQEGQPDPGAPAHVSNPGATGSTPPSTPTPSTPSATPPPPTHTPVPPSSTPQPPTDTPAPPTQTPVPPTHTPYVPPTETPSGPTYTPVPPSDTPVPPSSTPQPPTETPMETPPPSSTPVQTDTPPPRYDPRHCISLHRSGRYRQGSRFPEAFRRKHRYRCILPGSVSQSVPAVRSEPVLNSVPV